MKLHCDTLRASSSPREDFFGSRGGAETRRGIAVWL
jgi:hypothetical protein